MLCEWCIVLAPSGTVINLSKAKTCSRRVVHYDGSIYRHLDTQKRKEEKTGKSLNEMFWKRCWWIGLARGGCGWIHLFGGWKKIFFSFKNCAKSFLRHLEQFLGTNFRPKIAQNSEKTILSDFWVKFLSRSLIQKVLSTLAAIKMQQWNKKISKSYLK